MLTQVNEDSQGNLTFEKVWALFQESDRKFKEQMEESRREADRERKEMYRAIGDLSNRFGELAEHLVAPNILEKFNALGFQFTRFSNGMKIKEPGNPNSLAEIDITLENGDVLIAVEVKAKAKQADVDKHLSRMDILRRTANPNDNRKYLGAIAVAIMEDEIRDYIIQNGFYAIEQTGDTVKLTIPQGFTPREW